ncbi:unnamed protein product [Rotaria sp. Silwood1]|nr:unnamed protein product [Rotaria sp. Silwood1]CAF0954544.1 unnamed protein product [Rotaria sp. Silwood1]CAF3331278.1 unnamed protein product [Rotaria sp. Silwood1]CAF4625908.1 unnamed protein product [Rotaria sp. Silwood1]
MAKHTILTKRIKRPHAYENLISSLDTESDLNDLTLENLTSLEFDQSIEEDQQINKSVARSYSNLIYESLSYDIRRQSQVSSISGQLRNLRRKFSDRTDAIKEIIHQPPDYEDNATTASVIVREEKQQQQFPARSIFASDSESHASTTSLAIEGNGIKQRLQRILFRCIRKSGFRKPVDTDSNAHLIWLTLVAMAYLYNFISIPLRIAFPIWKNGERNIWLWMLIDYLCDVLYLIDIFFVQTRIKYLENGLWTTAFRLTAMKYFHSLRFVFDCLSLLPLDVLYFLFGFHAIFRLTRLLKIRSLTDFFRSCDRWVQSFFASVRLVRILALLLYVILSVHVYACIYFLFSNYERRNGVDNGWVYKIENQPRMSAYSYSFYYCFKIASTIGNIPSPETGPEYVFVITGYLLALFIFALLIGQIRDVFQSMNQRRSEYQNKVEQVMQYLTKFGIPKTVQDRVRNWFQYNWEDRNTLVEDDDTTLSFLPTTLQTELAISIHYDTLSKVQLFQDCERSFLHSLVLKLKPALFLPGDYICKKGEIGREMYIVNHGILDVFIDDKRIAGLEDGAVFGEISLLEVAGGNRRTADVISRGFSTLFTLHKADLNEQLKDFPEAGKVLRRKAKKLMKRSSKPEEEETAHDDGIVQAEPIIVDHPPKSDPKLLDTVLKAVGSKSKLAEVLTRPRPSIYPAVSLEVPDIAISTNHEPIRNSTDNDHHRNRIIPTLTVTPVDATTARIQTLRQRLFSTPLQNLPSAMQYPNDEDDLFIHRTLPTSETSVTLLFDDDLV